MYSHEIKRYMDEHDWKLTSDEFYKIMWSSPQVEEYKIHEIKKDVHSIYFYTNDGLSGYVWFDNYKEK